MELELLESLYPDTTREKEIEKIISFVKEGNSCQVVSMPGVGRGNLMGFLAYNRDIRTHHLGEDQARYHFVLANFSEIKNKPLFDAMKFLFLELSSSLHERRLEEEFAFVDGLFKESLAYSDEMILFQGFKRAIDYLTFEKQLSLVLLLERFETYIPTVTSDFFTNLRSIRNRAKYKFSVVFSLNRPLEEFLDPVLMADFHEYVAGHYVFLPLFDKPGIDFRIEYLEKITQKKIDKNVIAKILALTGGHGKLTRLCLETALSQNQSKNSITSQFMLGYRTIIGALWEIWYFLSPEEQDDILGISQEKNIEPSQFLKEIGLIKSGKIMIPLFAQFVKENIHKDIDNTLFYDAATNTIKRGNALISDNLTTSEFRLLKYLLENPEKVVEREEIIDHVWKDAKSVAGVTNQAVDQLVFRLRKKIEIDPNSPLLIQTVKGRGIKFTQV